MCKDGINPIVKPVNKAVTLKVIIQKVVVNSTSKVTVFSGTQSADVLMQVDVSDSTMRL